MADAGVILDTCWVQSSLCTESEAKMERGEEQRGSEKRIAAVGRDLQDASARLTGEDSYVLGCASR